MPNEAKRERARQYYLDNRDRIMAASRRNYRNPFASDYERLMKAQNGLCAICKRPEMGVRARVLALDHDHSAGPGALRGLLCSNCNRGLGYFGDDPDRMRAAIAYLEEWALARA